MRTKAITTGLMLVLIAATAGQAQVIRRGPSPTGYLGIRFDEIVTRGDGGNSDRIIVREVSKDSPAEKAGVKTDDEIVRINGLSTANGKFGALARTLSEGDTVTLTVKRDGKQRQFTLIAAKRPDRLAYFDREIIIAPDSVRRLMRLYLDSARVRLDSLKLPNIYIGRGDSVMFHLRGMRDTALFHYRGMGPDSVFFGGDSALTRIFRVRPGEGGWIGPPPNMFEFEGDLGPGMIFRNMELGARAIGGAELTEMDPGLADYFGATGLLALKVLPETPADRAGLQPGDVIVKAKDRAVRTVAELRSVIAANPDGVKLEVRRKGAMRTLELKTRSR